MKIDYSKLMEGDIWFGRDYGFLDTITKVRFFNDCGFVVKPFGGKLFYAAHIDRTGKLRFERLEDLNIGLIRRVPFIYETLEDRIKFRNRLIKLHEELIIDELQYLGDSIDMIDSEIFGTEERSLERDISFYVNCYRFITVWDGD